jgi:hypothetical protein
VVEVADPMAVFDGVGLWLGALLSSAKRVRVRWAVFSVVRRVAEFNRVHPLTSTAVSRSTRLRCRVRLRSRTADQWRSGFWHRS